jgi:FeS assembly protein IscX
VSAERGRVELSWRDTTEIAWALLDAHPGVDPLDLNFVDLHRMIIELPEFGDEPEASTEAILEAIVVAWNDEH